MKKALILSPLRSVSVKPVSHRGAPAFIYRDALLSSGQYDTVDINCSVKSGCYHENVNDYDEIWVYHGNDVDHAEMEVKTTSVNMPGGIESACGKQLMDFSHFKGKVFSIKCPFLDYAYCIEERLRKAREKGSTYDECFDKVDFENLKKIQSEATVVKHPNHTQKLAIGDSHTICMYRPGWTANDIPFKTLRGSLKEGLEELIYKSTGKSYNEYTDIDFYFGNIDVRHHFCRQDDPMADVESKVKEYFKQVFKMSKSGVKCRILELLPIEDESRKIPKTGYFLDKPFHGSWQERTDVRNHFNDLLEKLCQESPIEFVRWTDYLLNEKGELGFEHMEKPRSVHLSRASYPFWTGIEEGSEPEKQKPQKKQKPKKVVSTLEGLFE